MSEQDKILSDITSKEYEYGFVTDIETHTLPKGLSEDVVRQISALKEEPEWMLEYRLKAYRKWLTMEMPQWAHLDIQIRKQARQSSLVWVNFTLKSSLTVSFVNSKLKLT